MIEPKLSRIFLVLVPLLLMSNPAFAQFPEISCSDTAPDYELNSTFHNNLINLFSSLSINSPQNKGFYNTSYGNGLDKVYGRALCRGDASAAACKNCLGNASQRIANNCTKQAAVVWLEKCQIEYSYGTLSNAYTGKYPNLNSEMSPDRDEFCNALNNLEDALSSIAGRSKLMFAEGKHKLSRNVTLYGLVQCTRDISPGECGNCLTSAYGDLNGCQSSKGGAILSRTCNVRFELYRFYDSSHTKAGHKRKLIAAVCGASFALAIIVSSIYFYALRRKVNISVQRGDSDIKDRNKVSDDPEELPFTKFSVIKAATDNFSEACELGRGGFGTVYKGVMPDGKEVAIKRLSRKSWQGSQEFMNEIKLIAKLQHRNLVRLLSYGEERMEKLLIYEYMPNKSLDMFLLDSEKRMILDWNKRINIIRGIAKALLYLHEESRVKIVHRDLNPSNVLLDHEMSVKISDFGLARMFCGDQDIANTKIAVGTPGYMAPEYTSGGEFSFKSDVFSFGVILLEIISGRKNSREFHIIEHAWQLWKEGKQLDLVDPSLIEACPIHKAERCIHIGLSCVQENPSDRPMMSKVVILLENNSTSALPEPTIPAGPVGRTENQIAPISLVSSSSTNADGDAGFSSTMNYSVNQVTISTIAPR